LKGILVLWIIVAMGCLVLDFVTAGFLFVWFTIGGIAAIIALALGYSFSVQVIAFILFTGISFIAGYPMAKKFLKKTIPKTPTMEENFIGRIITADKDIKERERIKLDGIYWTVENKGPYILKNEKFKIIGLDGNKLIVKKEEGDGL